MKNRQDEESGGHMESTSKLTRFLFCEMSSGMKAAKR